MRDRIRPVDYRERAELDWDTIKKYSVLAAYAANCRIFNHLIGRTVVTLGKVTAHRIR